MGDVRAPVVLKSTAIQPRRGRRLVAVLSISRQSLPWYDEVIMPARSVLSVLFLLSAFSLAAAGQTPLGIAFGLLLPGDGEDPVVDA